MAAVQYDITAKRGDSFSQELWFQITPDQNDRSTWFNAYDFDEAVVTVQVKLKTRDDEIVLHFRSQNTDDQKIAIDVVTSKLTLVASDTMMDTIEPGTYAYDVQVLFNTGVKKTIAEGAFVVTGDITV